MAAQARWTPTQKVLYTSLVPAVCIVAALVLLSVLRSSAHSGTPSEASASPAAAAAQSAADERRALRRQFRDCIHNMGGDVNPARFRSRFSTPPDMKKLQAAYSVCRSILSGGAGAVDPVPRKPSTPPVA